MQPDLSHSSQPTTVPVDSIQVDTTLQLREALDRAVVTEYAAAMQAGVRFPPVTVFDDGVSRWLADGFHRVAAARQAEIATLSAEIRFGSRREALLHAAGANATHGLRRTSADKRRSILALLQDPEWSVWSDREIARRTGCDHKTVAALRRVASGEIPQMPRKVQRNGTSYSMRTPSLTSLGSAATTDLRPTNRWDGEHPSASDAASPDIRETPVAAPLVPIPTGSCLRLGLHHLVSGPLLGEALPVPLTSVSLMIDLLCVEDTIAVDWLQRRDLPTRVVVLPRGWSGTVNPGQRLAFYELLLTRMTRDFDRILVPELPDPELLLAAELTDRILIGAVPDPIRCAEVVALWECETGNSAEPN